MNKKIIKSPLNYIGGKYKLLKQILPLFPKKIDTFIDVFSGGANVGINVSASKYIFNDMNYKINEMFRYFQDNDIDLILTNINNRINEYNLSKTNEQGFLKFREQYNNNPNPLDLYVLSSYSYNYQFRFNNNLKYNNPFGKNRSCFSKSMKNNLITFTKRLQSINAKFTDLYFQDFDISTLNSNDFVYLDPPYIITTGSYNDGTRGFKNWDQQQELELYNFIIKLNNQGVKFALSNVLQHKGKENTSLIDFIKKNNFNIHNLNINYSNSSYNTKKGSSNEVLVTNY